MIEDHVILLNYKVALYAELKANQYYNNKSYIKLEPMLINLFIYFDFFH